ncbi:hypothetical protein P154DRAFT_523214 [Amniculicola lignicola CBS 123094]|uniref:Zn(2)-C6 fungal-type domain-containing protein n=1 Tax=Amniculicola lignicola CBS 123094 TaxID=1392246 RepID=A0A6A5WF24_9PLEO|nr:hypothetical protein P154DRAFT_523214 [Amniculicola lignicola CBS 123094]
MPKEQRNTRIPRQQPVSCRFCRTRKLRCSREAPCSNCVSRGISCELEAPVPPLPKQSEWELQERLRKLEELLVTKNRRPEDTKNAPQWDTPQNPPDIREASFEENLNLDVIWLESVCAEFGPSESKPKERIALKLGSVHDIGGCNHSGRRIPKCVYLPQHHEAKILLQKYIEHIDYLHHIVNIPQLPAYVDRVYASLSTDKDIELGQLVLLLSIFASATYSWVAEDCDRGLFASQEDANNQVPSWVEATRDVLDIMHRSATYSLEAVQGIVILGWVIINREELSTVWRSLLSHALFMSHEMGLHRVDHPSNAAAAKTVQAEIGRRVWWYLVVSDWFTAAKLMGLTEGVYLCNPRHMVVRQPLNINDDDLIDGNELVGQPLSQPTGMSYLLQRFKFGELTRRIVDRTPIMSTDAPGLGYQDVMDFDTDIQTFLNEIPAFFSMEKAQIMSTYHLDEKMTIFILTGGYMIKVLANSQRCKLHLPYFARGYVDSSFAYSRAMCVKSACLVIQNMCHQENCGIRNFTRYRSCALIFGVFIATVILLMDYCVNKANSQYRREVAHAFRVLHEARRFSLTATKLMDTMMFVFRKHQVALPKLKNACDAASIETHFGPENGSKWPSTLVDGTMMSGASDSAISVTTESPNEDVLPSYFTDFGPWPDQGPEMDGFDWDGIFSELNSSFV